MKRESELSVIPVIVFNASVAMPQRDRAFALGADDYLVKPLGAVDLTKAVARVLQQKR